MLNIKGLVAGYGGSRVISGVDFRIEEREHVSIIGPNGAGKTTMLRTISGLVRPSSGSITFQGKELTAMDPYAIARMGIIHVPEGRMVLTRMTVRENLTLGAYGRDNHATTNRDFDNVVETFPILGERLNQLAGTLSGGEQQMLAIGRGLMGAPKLLMLDEPSLGIAPIIVDRIMESIQKIRAGGVTILMVEQNAVMALAAADRAYALDLGKVTAHGLAKDLLEDPRVREAYLGL